MKKKIQQLNKELLNNKQVYYLGTYKNREYYMSGDKVWIARSDDRDIQSLCTVTLANETILEFNQVINRDYTRKEFFGWLYSTIKFRSGVNRTYLFKNKRMIYVINLIREFESTTKRDKRVTCTKIDDVGKVVNVEVEQNYYPLKKHKYILSISQGTQRVVYTHVEQPLLIYWMEKVVKSIKSCLNYLYNEKHLLNDMFV